MILTDADISRSIAGEDATQWQALKDYVASGSEVADHVRRLCWNFIFTTAHDAPYIFWHDYLRVFVLPCHDADPLHWTKIAAGFAGCSVKNKCPYPLIVDIFTGKTTIKPEYKTYLEFIYDETSEVVLMGLMKELHLESQDIISIFNDLNIGYPCHAYERFVYYGRIMGRPF